MLFIGYDGKTKCQFLCMKDVTAAGIKTLLEVTFADLGVENWSSRLVSLCVDGAAVNLDLGIRHGLATLLCKDVPWLVGIHCLNRRLELAAKNAFSKTYMDGYLLCL